MICLQAARERRDQDRSASDKGADQEKEERGEGGVLIGFPKRGKGLWLFLSAFPHLAAEAIASERLADDGDL